MTERERMKRLKDVYNKSGKKIPEIEERIRIFESNEHYYFVRYGLLDHSVFMRSAEKQLGL